MPKLEEKYPEMSDKKRQSTLKEIWSGFSDRKKMKYGSKVECTEISGMVKFCLKQRPKILKKHPEWDARQIAAEMKRKWEKLDQDERY